MPSLDDLKKRIASIKSTQKITKAMKMVAAAKLRRAQESAEKGRPFSEKMNNIILNLSGSIADRNNVSKFLVGTGKDTTHLCVVITADRGLCGGFNTNICRKARNYFDKILINSSPTYPVAPAIAIFNESFIFLIISVNNLKRYCNKILSFRELKASSCFSATVLFTFHSSRISCCKFCFF